MPRSYNEDLQFWAISVSRYSIDLEVAALLMSPKTIQHCVLKCLSTEEVKVCRKFRKTIVSLCIRKWNLKS